MLKLKTVADGATSSSSNTSANRIPDQRRQSSAADKSVSLATPPGYMATLVNKIANNISLKLHNIILKYVEEDIVVSMNIQLLTFDSADKNWEPAFIDINPTKVVLKKVINISDLTICLDKRNAMGKIDICQEPLLYRCTLQARMLRKYNLTTAHSSSITRIDIFTDCIELNISAQQYPMLVRLLALAMALREGRIKPKVSSSSLSSSGKPPVIIDMLPQEEETADADAMVEAADATAASGSYFAWAWNMIPTIFPEETIDEETRLGADGGRGGHFIHTGLYVNTFRITFKSQELTGDNLVQSSRKLRYHPILKIKLTGIYGETVVLGPRFFNLKGGISSIGIYPLGICSCGQKHRLKTLLISGDLPTDHRAYLDDSLKDPNAVENKDESRSYDRLWLDYSARITDDFLIRRTPAIAFDIVHNVTLADGDTGSMVGSDLEYSNLSESYEMRAILSTLTVNYGTTMEHTVATLQEYLNRYDYAPYGEMVTPTAVAQLSPPLAEDYDALMADCPMKLMSVSIRKSAINCHIADHSYAIDELPVIRLELDSVNVDITNPLYPNRLVHLTCQLPLPPAKLLDNCYTKYALNSTNMNVCLCRGQHDRLQLVSFSSTLLSYRSLLKPQLWTTFIPPVRHSDAAIESIAVTLSRPQMICVHQYVNDFRRLNHRNNGIDVNICVPLQQDVWNEAFPVLDIRLARLKATVTQADETVGVAAICESINGLLYYPERVAREVEAPYKAKVFLMADQKDTLQSDWLMVTVQVPVAATLKYPPVFIATMNRLNFSVDPMLSEFFDYKLQRIGRKNSEISEFPMRAQSPRKSLTLKASSRSGGGSGRQFVHKTTTESIHSSSEQIIKPVAFNASTSSLPAPDEPAAVEQQPMPPRKAAAEKLEPTKSVWHCSYLYRIARALVISIDIRPISVYVPERSVFLRQATSQFLSCMKLLDAYTVFQSPFVQINSSHHQCSTNVGGQFPLKFPESVWQSTVDGFPWTMALTDIACSVAAADNGFISSNHTKLTLAATIKPKSSAKKDCGAADLSFAIHIDTAPIEVKLTEPDLRRVYAAIGLLNKIVASSVKPLDELDDLSLGGGGGISGIQPDAIDSNELKSQTTYQSIAKEFIGASTLTGGESERSGSQIVTTTTEDNVHVIDASSLPPPPTVLLTDCETFSVLVQWTLTRFMLQLRCDEHKFIIQLEDMISSIDQQDVYTKIKIKIGTFSGICMNRRANDEWHKNSAFSVIPRTDTTDDRNKDQGSFCDVTITRAETKNVHNKWGATNNRKQQQLLSTITEIMVNIQSVDVSLHIPLVAVFMPFLMVFMEGDVEVDTPIYMRSVAELPLLFFKSKRIQIFVPITDDPTDMSNQCNVLFAKVNTVILRKKNHLYLIFFFRSIPYQWCQWLKIHCIENH